MWLRRKLLYDFVAKREKKILRKFIAVMLNIASTQTLTNNVNGFIKNYLFRVAFNNLKAAYGNNRIFNCIKDYLINNGMTAS